MKSATGDVPATRRDRLRKVGPGAVVAAAFIGPGTVTTATLAGVGYGTALLWALTFSTIATLVLQEMSARLGLVTGAGLGEAVRARFRGAWARAAAVGLVIAAIAIGNAAYETGNLLGAALGVNGVVGGDPRFVALGIAGFAAILLWTGRYRLIERVLVGMVVVMSLVFLATAVVLLPAAGQLLRHMFVPVLPEDPRALVTAVGLIGTTVVPYNLFLHAAAVSEKWGGVEWLPAARLDLGIAIVLGGLVSMAIMVTSAVTLGADAAAGIASAGDMARQLEPLLGSWARVLFAVGLLAAGLTSSITAPLAAAWATAGALGWGRDLRDRRVRAVWGGVIAVGAAFAVSGVRPVPAILFAQVANGLLLPFIAVFLLLAVNDATRMGERRNGLLANIIASIVVLLAAGLGLLAVYRALG
ncbi:MAG TPA: Nramp family divalent metal transporter [Planctomycetaceae bacterium]|nr:Nramp family divalent metal transporter [Planctomycetaceae bacterium]